MSLGFALFPKGGPSMARNRPGLERREVGGTYHWRTNGRGGGALSRFRSARAGSAVATSGGGVNKALAPGGGAGCECQSRWPLSRSEPVSGGPAVPASPAAAVAAPERLSARPGGGGAARERRVAGAGRAPLSTAPLSFVSRLRGRSCPGAQPCSLKMADGNEDARADDLPGPAFEGYEAMELACPAERSGHVAVSDGRHMFVWGGYKSNQVRGLYDFYLPREELWIYNMETGRWRKINTEGDVPPSMSGSCAVCVDRVLYLFGGHHSRGNTNKVSVFKDYGLEHSTCWIQGLQTECYSGKELIAKEFLHRQRTNLVSGYIKTSTLDALLIFFGGYGYLPEDKVLGTFEFDETSFWNSSHPRGWNDHVHILDTETFVWSQPITTGKAPSPRAAHACATVGNKGFVFGGRYRDARMNDLHCLNLDTWEWNELSWHSLTPVSSDHLFLFGGFTTEKQPLSDAWTYCISKNEWIQFNHPYTEKPRLWHTACASDEGEVIVFGGCANNLLVHHRAAHSNEVLIFSVQPKSLVRLSLEAVICFKEMLANSWNCLPKHLLHSVNQRFGSNNTSGS
ncbi:hypothetical protein U0070_004043 [Myodes glareolus]|uniref:Kelch domain containing 2 n=1 Tax=Myodes glareolus TaxID=447135 RepID=A0AAW0K9W0_MYOGA